MCVRPNTIPVTEIGTGGVLRSKPTCCKDLYFNKNFTTTSCKLPKNRVDFLRKLHRKMVVVGKNLCYNEFY